MEDILKQALLSQYKNKKVRDIIGLAVAIHADRPDLVKAFSLATEAGRRGLWYWIHWFGWRDEFCSRAEEVRRCLLPMPPPELRGRVVGDDSSPEDFVVGGLVDWRTLTRAFECGGYTFNSGSTLLDFGVGSGRILRYFSLFGGVRLLGADADGPAVAWCSQNLPIGEFLQSPPVGRLPLASGTVDALYAFSVFTHLNAENTLLWISELARILAPGGVAVITTGGWHCAREVASGKRAFPHPDPEVMAAALDRLRENGFVFFPYGELHSQHEATREHFAEWDLESYGTTYLTQEYIRRSWSHALELVDFWEAPDKWQDYAILRKARPQ